jgi:hypothetical protein
MTHFWSQNCVVIIETKNTVALFMLFGKMVEVEPWEGKDIFYLIFPVFFGVQLKPRREGGEREEELGSRS